MILFLLLYICFSLADDGIYNNLDDSIPSGAFKNDKYYIFSPADIRKNTTDLYIYYLKDGPIAEINKTVVNIGEAPYGYIPKFLNFAQDLNGTYSDFWMIESYLALNVTDRKLNRSQWMARIVDDKKLELGSSIISLPNYLNFPKGGFSQNIVNINNEPVMYVIGGYTFSRELNSTVLTNCVFKYVFNTGNWTDLSERSNSILPPIANHKSLQVDNNLFILNGVSPNIANATYPKIYSTKKSMKFNTINKMYKFDLLSEKWTVIPLKTNLDAVTYGDGLIFGASYDYYDGNIITYGSVEFINTRKPDPHFGTLSLTSYEWQWIPIKSEYSFNNTLGLGFHQTLIIRDQLILFHGYSNQLDYKSLYVINLKDFKFQSTLDYSGSTNSSESHPMYINITIGLGATLGCSLLIASIIFFIRYRKKKLRNLNNNMQPDAIWVPSEKDTGILASDDRVIEDSQTCEIFTIGDNNVLESEVVRSSTLKGDLASSTLVDTKSNTNISSNDTVGMSTKNKKL